MAIFLSLAGCGNNSQKEATETKQDTASKAKEQLETSKDSQIPEKVEEKMVSAKAPMELLQGKWQSLDDPKSFIIFENDHRKEMYEGDAGAMDDEVFVLSDQCGNESNKNMGVEKEKDKYISCKKSDMCWYIIQLNDNTLSLSYVGRGNTLTYRKVNSK